MAEVLLGGVWLHTLGNVAEVKWSTSWGPGPSGSALASCTVAVSPSNGSSLLRLGSTFEVWCDGVKRFGGVLTESDRGFPRTLNAVGYARRAGDFDAVDGSGNPTTNPQTAVTQAIANGLPWSGPTAFTSASFGANPAAAVRVGALLDDWAPSVSKRWGADVNGVAFATADPTTVSWYLDASDLPIGVASDGMFTVVRYRYATAVDSGGTPTATAGSTVSDAAALAYFSGAIEYPMDLTPMGVLTAPTALAYATSQLALLTAPQWLSPVTTNSTRLLTPGGHGAHLSQVRAGQMVRLFNVPNHLGGLRNELGLDVVLGEVEYEADNPSRVTIAPIGLAVRDIAGLSAQAREAAAA